MFHIICENFMNIPYSYNTSDKSHSLKFEIDESTRNFTSLINLWILFWDKFLLHPKYC